MADEEKQQKLQQKYMEFQMIDQQIKQIQKQLQMVDMQMQELISTQEALDELSEVKKGTDFLSPIASGIFIKGKITESKELIVNVGSNVTVRKTIPEVKELLKTQLDELEMVQQNTTAQFQTLTEKATQLEKDLHELVK